MKIGIVTCGDYWNYGNRLQNFALKYIIETHHSREVISIIGEQQTRGRKKLSGIQGLLRLFSINKRQRLMAKRGIKFLEFSNIPPHLSMSAISPYISCLNNQSLATSLNLSASPSFKCVSA